MSSQLIQWAQTEKLVDMVSIRSVGNSIETTIFRLVKVVFTKKRQGSLKCETKQKENRQEKEKEYFVFKASSFRDVSRKSENLQE